MIMMILMLAFPVSANAAVKLSKKKATVTAGKTLKLKVKGTKKKVKWKTSDKQVATVSKKGVVKGIKRGDCTITAKVGKKKLTCKVTVTQPVTGIKMAGSRVLEKGKTFTLSPLVFPVDANNRALTWKSSNPAVATVSSAGVVKGKADGTAIITATAKDGSGKSAACTVTVKTPVTREQLQNIIKNVPKDVYSLNTVYNSSLGTAGSAIIASSSNYSFSSSNAAVLTITSNGEVIPQKAGTAVVTLKANDGFGASVQKTVKVVDMKDQYKTVVPQTDDFLKLFTVGAAEEQKDAFGEVTGIRHHFGDNSVSDGWMLYGVKDFAVKFLLKIRPSNGSDYERTLLIECPSSPGMPGKEMIDFSARLTEGIRLGKNEQLVSVEVTKIKGSFVYIKKSAVTNKTLDYPNFGKCYWTLDEENIVIPMTISKAWTPPEDGGGNSGTDDPGTGDDPPSENSKLVEYAGHYYYVFEEGKSWEEAKAYCESKNGYLACFSAQGEADKVKPILLPELTAADDGLGGFWIGAYKESGTPAEWAWVNGSPVTFTNWADGQPDDSGTVVKVFADDGLQWDDSPGEDHCPVYEIEAADAEYAVNALKSACQTSCKSTTYGGHTYILLEERLDWENTQQILDEVGIEGYLACFETEAEYNAVSAAIMDSDLEKNREDCGGGYWIGLYQKSPAASAWKWVSGEPFSFTQWSDGQPDNSGEYVKIVPDWDYLWDDLSGERHCFVCEWDSLESVPEELRQVSN